jgi:ribosomal protein L40E
MPKQPELVVLPNSPDAASLQTVSGWVSRSGHFFGANERLARYDGSTHSICTGCGAKAPKSYTLCDTCRDVEETARWNKREIDEWDGTTPFCLDDGSKYFFDIDDFFDWFDDGSFDDGFKPEDVRLLLCVPVFFKQVDTEYWNEAFSDDDLESDHNPLPSEIAKALVEFNKVIKGYTTPAYWMPGKKRIIMTKGE